MDDRYLFKAKDYMTDEWIAGSLVMMDWDSGYVFIAEPCEFASTLLVRELLCTYTRLVKKETVCRCSGLEDKNGNLIWENDIVEIGNEDGYFSVDWDEDVARFAMNGIGLTVDFDNYWSYEVEVVGNKFDNPKLLE